MPPDAFPIDEREGHRISLHDADTGYRLVFNNAMHDPAMKVHFKTPDNIFITGRTWEDYKRLLPALFPLSPGAQYVEVGAGLSDLAPTLVEKGVAKAPIVIDPARYDRMDEMLAHALTLRKTEPLIEEHAATVERLLRNCRGIRDSTRVLLRNISLGDAQSLPDLAGKADIVIDLQGPTRYPETEVPEIRRSGTAPAQVMAAVDTVRELAEKLLKPGGTYVSGIRE